MGGCKETDNFWDATANVISFGQTGRNRAQATAAMEEESTQEDEKNARVARQEQARSIVEGQLEAVKKNRKAIVNPYAGMTNQMANLGVATQAAEMQAEQTDIALANSLDAMRSSGAGAGGATALAQAALQSKKGISATLQTQEAANQKAAAQGAQNLQKMQADGEKFVFNAEETRSNADMNRASKQIDSLNQNIESTFDAYTQADLVG